MADVWTALRPGRVVRVAGALPPPPPEIDPAVVSCRLPAVPGVGETVEAVLAHLDAAARRSYPDWLPGAEAIPTAAGAGAAAVRTLARRAAAHSPQFGPFLADLAERSLRRPAPGRRGADADAAPPPAGRPRFPAEVRAAGLARVLAAAAHRPYVVLDVIAPVPLPEAAERRLSAAADWLASRGGFAVALTTVSTAPDTGSQPRPPDVPGRTAPAVARSSTPVGRPHPRSEAEQRLERALAGRPWAVGREWNALFQPDPLSPEFRIDLLWRAERCAVEVDGPEHHTPQRYEADRRRDTALQLAGFAVLRFTNEQVLSDVAAVVAAIEKLVTGRRRTKG